LSWRFFLRAVFFVVFAFVFFKPICFEFVLASRFWATLFFCYIDKPIFLPSFLDNFILKIKIFFVFFLASFLFVFCEPSFQAILFFSNQNIF